MTYDPYPALPDDDTPSSSESDTAQFQKTQEIDVSQAVVLPDSFPQFDAPLRQPNMVRPVFTPSQARQESGGGCVLPGLAVGVVVLSLVVLALFLPPLSLWNVIDEAINDEETGDSSPAGLDFKELSDGSPRIEAEGLVIEADPAQLTNSYSVNVVALSPTDYLAGNTPDQGWYCETDLPAQHALASPVYSLLQQGTPPGQLSLSVQTLPEVVSVGGTLGLYSWNATSGAWEFLPSQGNETMLAAQLPYLPRCVALFRAAESAREVGLTLAVTETFTPGELAVNVNVYPGQMRPMVTGALQGVLAQGFEARPNDAILPVIQNYKDPAVVDVATIQQILSNSTVRSEHARQIAAFVLREEGNYAGVMVHYRDVPADLRDEYTALIHELADLLHSANKTLSVVIPAGEAPQNTGGYDWRALGTAADVIVIEMWADPMAYAPGGPVETLLTWAVSQMDRQKLRLGLSALSIEDQGNGLTVPVSLDEALGHLGEVQIDPAGPVEPGQTITASLVNPASIRAEYNRDTTVQTPYIRYLAEDGTTLRTMWITDPVALSFRLQKAAQFDLGGVVVSDLMASGVMPGLDAALLAYRLNQPGELGSFQLSLEWIVREGDTILTQAAGQLDQPFSYTADEPHPELVIEAQLNGAVLGSTPLEVAALPTPTPTVEPTLEPTIAPTVEPTVETAAETTPVPAVTQVAGAVALDGPLPTVDPAVLAGAQIDTTFEPGVQVMEINANSILNTGRTHLVWVKINVPFEPGQTPDSQQSTLDNIQANGFKILFNVVGNPTQLAEADRVDYINQYAAFVGGLATMGADGIEIWSQMNSATMWPQIDPAQYVQLLAYSYVAIKNANPNTIVITGALLPLVESVPDQAVSDDVYYAGLAEAGAATYADCIGVQYLQGTVAPDATSGDPRGDAAIYYLPAMTDRVWNAFAGAKPLCYTALGYLSAEGYSALPEAYTWAQTNTTASQAAWLAAAIQANLASDRIRLMIISNMDATAFTAEDVSGGYAIIRPDTSCPACEAITPVLENN